MMMRCCCCCCMIVIVKDIKLVVLCEGGKLALVHKGTKLLQRAKGKEMRLDVEITKTRTSWSTSYQDQHQSVPIL